MLEFIALLATATLFGGMVAFSVLFAPLIFIKLPAETAGQFIRAVFPWYYVFIIAVGIVAALLSSAHSASGAIVLAVVALGGIIARQILMPAINRARDANLAGDESAGLRFSWLHRSSVALNTVQMIGVAGALWFFVG